MIPCCRLLARRSLGLTFKQLAPISSTRCFSSTSSWRDSVSVLARRTTDTLTSTTSNLVIKANDTVTQARHTLQLKHALNMQLDAFAGFFVGMQGGELHQWTQGLCSDLGFRLPQDVVLSDIRSIVPILLVNAPALVMRSTDMQGTLKIVAQHLLIGAHTTKTTTLRRIRQGDTTIRTAAALALQVAPDALDDTLDQIDATVIALDTAAPLARKLVLLHRAIEA
jgi:hypothetical protein